VPGGEATIAVEHWPECLNPLLACAQPETYQSVLYHVLPRAMQFAPDGSLVASPLLADAPTLDNGGLTQAPFTVRFRISDRAVWDDGSPITSEDFAFTWKAILHTRGSVMVDTYQRIVAVDTIDPKTAVLKFDEPWAGWTELFGGSKGFVLEAAAFPDEDPEAPTLARDMQSDIPFSGGPFKLEEWIGQQPAHVGERAVLMRNDRYFGPKALLDEVTFVPWIDLPSQFQNFLDGEQDAMALGPSDLATTSQILFGILDAPVIASSGADSTYFEALWFNAHEKPLNHPLVREALTYSIDREKLVDTLAALNNSEAHVLNCGFLTLPNVGSGCRTKPFERFPYDPAKSIQLLEQAGYDCSSLPCTRKGKPLQVRYFSQNLNELQSTTQQLVVQGAQLAGFSFKLINFEAGVLFGSDCPWRNMPITGCAVQIPFDESMTDRFACDQIPQPGQSPIPMNWIEWCNAEADRLMKASDRALDPETRQSLLDQVYELQADDMIGLPLFVIPTVVAWRVDRLAGPIDTYLSTPYGPFFNIDQWYEANP
jgi:ABC-type transport system substrate-binding protein